MRDDQYDVGDMIGLVRRLGRYEETLMKRINMVTSVLCLLSLCATLAQEESPSEEPKRLVELRAKYMRTRVAVLKPVLTQYKLELDQLQRSLTQAGDLNGALSVQAEANSLADDISVIASGFLPKPKPKVLRYNPATGWMSTGIRVAKGQKITIRAKGQIVSGKIPCDADGLKAPQWVSCQYVKDVNCLKLLAYCSGDKSHYYEVGKENTFITQDAGHLFIGLNDSAFSDNAGELEVEISAQLTLVPERLAK